MTTTLRESTTGLKRPAWLLIASLPVFVVYLVVASSVLSDKVEDTSAELTPHQLDGMRGGWIAASILWFVPVVIGALGLLDLSRRVPGPARLRSVAKVGALLSIPLLAVWLVLQLSLLGADGPTLGDNGIYAPAVALSVFAFWAAFVSTIAMCALLRRSGIARVLPWIVGVLCVLYLVFDLLTYLPAFFGSDKLADAVGLPPFLIAVFWAVIGGGLLRHRVRSGA